MNAWMQRWEMDRIGRDGLALREVPVPTPQTGEVLVKVARSPLIIGISL